MNILNFSEIHIENELFLISILALTAIVLGYFAKRLHLPKITGYIAAGIIVGQPVLNLISEESFEKFRPITMFALGLMSITIGAHMNFHKLKTTGKRVVSVFLAESLISVAIVFLMMYFIGGQSLTMSLLVASLSIATGPATTVGVVKETRSKGLLVNTIMPVVALNNVFCIVAFSMVAHIITQNFNGTFGFFPLFIAVTEELFWDLLIGVSAGYLLIFVSEKVIASNSYLLTTVLITVITITGIAEIMEINAMLPCMVVGIVVANSSPHRNRILTIFEEIEHLIMIIFFALAGAHMNVASLGAAGVLGALYFIARTTGKIFGGGFGAYISGAPKRIYKYVGTSLLAQAGVVIGLVIMAGEMEALKDNIELLTTLVLAIVALNEIFGPPALKWSLVKGGDANHDRPKLIEFIQEEYILPSMKATTKDEALEEIIDFYARSHKTTQKELEEIRKSVIAREKEASTGLVSGIAIPHGVVEEGPIIRGAIGISKKGIDFKSLDNRPAQIIVLIITPEKYKEDMHLKVLAELSKLLSQAVVREQLFASTSSLEVCEILREQEQGDFNYFLEED